MMTSEDIRAVNRLDRNIKRLLKARDLLDLVAQENDVADLDLWQIAAAIQRAEEKVRNVRKAIVGA